MRNLLRVLYSFPFVLPTFLFAVELPIGEVFFLENRGQLAEEIYFQAEAEGQQIRFLKDGISFARMREVETEAVGSRRETYQEIPGFQGEEHFTYEAMVWTTRFRNALSDVQPLGGKSLPGKYHYLKGSDKSKWNTNANRFTDIRFSDVYPGIDIQYYSTESYQLKYDVILHPGADIEDIEITMEGINSLSIAENGNLIIETPWGSFEESIPYSYQTVQGNQMSRNVQFTLVDSLTYGFEVIGEYDLSSTLIIDPLTLEWGTFFHSGTSDDYLIAISRDSEGNLLATGYTKALSFPTTAGIYQEYFGGSLDAYVLKMNADATEVIFATYLGGTDWELAYGLSVNSLDEPYITGFTRSENYPTTASAWQTTHGGGFIDGFATRLSADGTSAVFSSYLGGSNRDYIYDIEVDEAGNAYFTGITHSDDFPLTAAAFQNTLGGEADAFVAKAAADGSSLVFSTYVGGDKIEIGQDIILNADGEVFIGGNTSSHNFPISADAVQSALRTSPDGVKEDGFVAKLSFDGEELLVGTYLGGEQLDGIFTLTLDESENILVSGSTYSTDFPTSGNAFQRYLNGSGLGNGEVFVSKLSPNADEILFSTLLGGDNLEFVKSIKINSEDQILVLGATRSTNFPVYNTLSEHQNMYDIFISVLTEDGSDLVSSMLLGGEYNDYPRSPGSLHLQDDKITLGLTTHSGDIPTPGETYQNDKINGTSDAPIIYQVTTDDILAPFEHSISGGWYTDQQAIGITFSSFEIQEESELVLQRKSQDGKWGDVQTSTERITSDTYLLWDETVGAALPATYLYRIKVLKEQATYFSTLVEVESELVDEAYISLYPNPAKGMVQIEFSPHFQGNKLAVYNEQGQKVASWELPTNLGNTSSQSLSDLPAGIYTIISQRENGRSSINRLVVK